MRERDMREVSCGEMFEVVSLGLLKEMLEPRCCALQRYREDFSTTDSSHVASAAGGTSVLKGPTGASSHI